MLISGGIYKLKDVSEYIIIININDFVYYFTVFISLNENCIMTNDKLQRHLKLLINEFKLKNLHDFFYKNSSKFIEKNIDGYLGKIKDEYFIELQKELIYIYKFHVKT